MDIIIGPPGSGKGTISKILQKEYNYIHIDTGNLIRNTLKNKNHINYNLINNYVKNGKIIPSNITFELIQNEIKKYNKTDKIILDGFPKNYENLNILIENNITINKIIILNCDNDILINRLISRSKHNMRPDNNLNIIKKRVYNYSNEIKLVIDYFKSINNNFNYIDIDSNDNIENIFNKIIFFLES